ncbi:hypothetical protein N0V93_000233 [Gnomoniopsis smithogilvyi]|uniref:Short-chain dehydrogenase n=1 Tax=Gnomoniopsis smithogilvyi TaxID=1191159 RepID=A0A9W9D015_9PEZI|nr:hypothetical protein N0V93_000233 [Gnomoniopsis smithogilvyi]
MPGKYAQLHTPGFLAGPGDARPTGLQILQDENRFDGTLRGKVAVVTGCSSGIGVPMVEALAAAGTAIYAGVRAASMDRAREELTSVLGDRDNRERIHLIELDLTSLDSVKSFADEVKKREQRVNLLINNAGVMAIPTRKVTADGLEMQFGTNYVAHFYLFQCLKAHLLVGAQTSPGFASRVVITSSSGHRASTVDLDDINLEVEGKYNPFKAYGHSKTASIWMTNYIARLYGSQGVHGYSVMPGGVETGLQKHIHDLMKSVQSMPGRRKYMKSVEQGCASTIWAATARQLEGKGGVYCEDCEVAGPVP